MDSQCTLSSGTSRQSSKPKTASRRPKNGAVIIAGRDRLRQQIFADHPLFRRFGGYSFSNPPSHMDFIAFVELDGKRNCRCLFATQSKLPLSFNFATESATLRLQVRTRVGRRQGLGGNSCFSIYMPPPSSSPDCCLAAWRETNNAVYKKGTTAQIRSTDYRERVAASALYFFSRWQRATCSEPSIGMTNPGEGEPARKPRAALV